MSALKISVIIPTHNRKMVLGRAIQSVLRQTLPPDEILVIDDGSTDHTAEFVSETFPQVILLKQPNKGVSAARNSGIRISKYDWLAFLDSDDEWLPQKLEKQVAALKIHPDFKICHTNEIWIRRGRRVNPKKRHQKFGGYIYEKCLPLCVISPSSVMIHRSVFEDIGVFDENLPACEDYDFWLRTCVKYPVLYIEEPLIVKYGGHEDQLSKKFWGMDRFRIYALEKMLNNQQLDARQELQTLEVLLEKISIYMKGAHRRGKEEEFKKYQEKYFQYSKKLQKLRNKYSSDSDKF